MYYYRSIISSRATHAPNILVVLSLILSFISPSPTYVAKGQDQVALSSMDDTTVSVFLPIIMKNYLEGPFVPKPDLAIRKSSSLLSAAPGDLLVYSLTYTNTGNVPLSGITISETLPVYTSFDPGSSSPGWVDSGAPGIYLFLTESLDPFQHQAITFAVRLDDSLPVGVDNLLNTARIGDNGAQGPDDHRDLRLQ